MIHLMRHVSRATVGLLAANIISTLNQRLLASILLTYHYNLSINNCQSVLDDISFETKHLTLKPTVTVAEKIQGTVSLNANAILPNVCDTGTLLKE